MDVDYPAAHSMCVSWFAVDQDGNVGYFYSGEAGAAPSQAPPESATLSGRLAEVLPRGEVLEDLHGRRGPGREEATQHCSYALPERGLLMFLDSADPIRDEIEAGRATQVQATEGMAFVLAGTSKEVYDRVHAAGACRGCFWHWIPDPDDPPRPAELGLFWFQHPMWNALAFPYERLSVPAQPIHVDQLPPDIRQVVKQVVLNLRFRDTPHIQPAEHLPCECSEPAYVDSTGTRLRPVPGKEKEYAEEYDELAESYKGRYKMGPRPKK
jgi:hypothetical protein